MTHLKSSITGIAVLLLAGCASEKEVASDSSDGDKRTTNSAFLDADISTVTLGGQATTVAGVTYSPPSDWTDHGAKGMRKADYSFGPVEGESDSASVSVFYFGAGGGGTVSDNISRWTGQMSLPDGKDASGAAIRNQITIDSMTAHIVEVAGTFNASMGGPMSGKSVAKENYRMVGVVLEGPRGNLFFKLTGPDKTASSMITGFAAMIQGAKKTEK